MAETLNLTKTETVTIGESSPDALVVEARYEPSSRKPPPHLHPQQDEHFEVLEGRITARVRDAERTLEAGDTFDVPRGTVHQMWNPGPDAARVSWTTTPAGRTELWFRAIDALNREGRAGPAAFAALLREYDDVFRLAVKPEPVVRGAVGLLGRLGRLRGSRG